MSEITKRRGNPIAAPVALLAMAVSAAGFWAFGGQESAGNLPEPAVRLPKMAKAPVIDGVVDEDEWSGAVQMQKFCVYRKRGAMNAEATFRLGRDSENIYIAISSEIGPFGQLRNVKPAGRSDLRCFDDDCVEFDFIPDWFAKRPTVLHAVVNFNGAYRVTAKSDGRGVEWEGMDEFRFATTEKDGMCHFEYAVPLRTVRFDTAPGAVHGIRIARNWKRVYDDPFGRQTSWSAQDGAFGTPANCPQVVFDDDAPVVRMTDLGTHNKGKGDLTVYRIAATVSNPTAKPLDLKIAYSGRPVNSQPCVFSETFTLKPGESRDFASKGPVLGEEAIALSFSVTSADGSVVYHSRQLDFQANWPDLRWIGGADDVRAVGFSFAYYPSRNVVNARIDLLKAERRPRPTPFTVSVRSADGKTLAEGRFTAESDVADVALDVPDLEPVTIKTGNPKYEIVLEVPGVKDGIVKGSFFRHDLREWENNKIGLSNTVVPPFTPLVRVKSGGDEVVKVVLREHRVDGRTGLWKQVSAAGKDLLARPVRFVATGDGPAAEPSVESVWDYDGVCEVRLSFAPGRYGPTALEIPIKGAEARLMHVCVDGLRNNYAGAVPPGTGRVWDSTRQGSRIAIIGDWLPYVWVGGTLRGIAVFGDNDRGWVKDVGRKVPCFEIVREGDGTVALRMNIVQRPVELKEPRTIRFGLQATPVKPMAANWRAESAGELAAGCSCWGGTGGCVEPFDSTTGFWDAMARARKTGKVDEAYLKDALSRFEYKGAPGSKEREEHMMDIARNFRTGQTIAALRARLPDKIVFYTNARGIAYGLDAAKTYADEWTRWEYLPRLDRDFARNDRCDYDLDPVKSFRDYAVFWYRKMIESGACDALYWDCVYPAGNWSRPLCDTYPLDGGEWQPSVGVFAMKALVRRCAVMQAEIGAAPMNNWVHMTNTSIAPVLGFAGVNYDWEDTADLQTFQDRYGRDYILASTIGRQFGNRVSVIGYISKTTPENLARLVRSGVGVTLCHELVWRIQKPWCDANRRLVEWGYRSPAVDVWNYWDEDVAYPLSFKGEECVSIAMAKRSAREAAAVVCDWGEGGEVAMTPDCAALGISRDFACVDMETGREWPVEDGVVKLKLKKHDYAMLLLKGR